MISTDIVSLLNASFTNTTGRAALETQTLLLIERHTLELQRRVEHLESVSKYMQRNVEDFYFVVLAALTFGKTVGLN